MNITEHRDEDKNLTWIEVVDDRYHAGFSIIDGELIETVEFTNGFPDWDEGGCTNPDRAENPELLADLERRFA